MTKKLVKQSIKERPILFSISIIIFIVLTAVINGNHSTFQDFFKIHTYWFSIPYFLLNIIIIPLLVGVVVVLATKRVVDLKKVSGKKGFFGVMGTLFGILGGACPGCFAGLFPALLGLFGVTATIGNLPLYGFELGLISSILLIISIKYLSKDLTCKI